MSLSPVVKYAVGLQRHGVNLFIYFKPWSQGGTVFDSKALVGRVKDETFTQGRIGFVSYNTNVRFFNTRAGLVASASTADYSSSTDRGWSTATGIATRSAFDTYTVTLPQLATAGVKDLLNGVVSNHTMTYMEPHDI